MKNMYKINLLRPGLALYVVVLIYMLGFSQCKKDELETIEAPAQPIPPSPMQCNTVTRLIDVAYDSVSFQTIVNLESDTTMCVCDTLVLDGSQYSNYNFLWFPTGDTSKVMILTTDSSFWLQVTPVDTVQLPGLDSIGVSFVNC
ncbi:MAG TPA: hypothetical protein EYN69_00705 [Flavobacteriales bacterium]|nr:hypothetical protein [Flavobacteriales bacterium]